MQFLRQNTAVIIAVGPFYDKTDGVTIETALTITNERITLTADTDAGSAPTLILDNITGATAATSNDLNYITGQDNGMMQIELSAADTNRVGRCHLSITDAANHVPVFHELFILPQAIYDWLTGVIVPLPANVTQLLGTAWLTPGTAGTPDVNTKLVGGQTASAAGAVTFPGTIASTTNITAAAGCAVSSLGADVITAASIATDAITAAKIAADAIGSSEFAQAAADKVWASATRSLTTAAGIKKNTALANFEWFMRDSTDHVSGKTGLTVVEEVSIDGAAFAALTNTFAEVANGIYKINLAAADLNGDVITLKFTGTGADPTLVTIKTEA